MKLSKFAVTLLVFILILSVFIAKVSNIITINTEGWRKTSVKNRFEGTQDDIIISNSVNHLLWFIQISDLHISIFHDMSRITEFQEFCDITVGSINPAVVLASGDLTDAKQMNNVGSRQFEEEWIHYRNVLDKCKVAEKTVWLDVRGNHDNFNVPGPIAKENYYRNYSVQGSANPRSYIYEIQGKEGDKYSFIALDACLEPGPRRPFNFMGIVTQSELNHIKELSKKAMDSNVTVWFGHYPTSCILSPNKDGGVRSVIGDYGTAYLCGHLHTLGGAVPNMYTLQHSGYLELELGDWKDNRMYRLGAIDHGLFSFIDIKHRDWPVILVTNPKHALFIAPSKEPLHRMETSTHIRILVFSLSTPLEVQIRIDKSKWEKCNNEDGPLYTCQWQPSEYRQSLHHLEVYAVDEEGRDKTVIHPFSLDGTRLSFGFMPRFVLMCDINTFFHLLFGMGVIVCILPLCILRCMRSAVIVQYVFRPRFHVRFFQKILQKLWIIANINTFYYAFVLYPLYLAIGPWAIGEIIENHVGVIFVWGTFVNGAYLPGSFTYIYGFAQLLLFQFPLMVYTAHCLDRRLKVKSPCPNKKFLLCMLYIWKKTPLILIISIQTMLLYSFWLEYGGLAVLLGPMRTWSIFYAFWLSYKVNTVPEAAIREAISTLYSNKPVVVTVTPCEEERTMIGEPQFKNIEELAGLCEVIESVQMFTESF